MSHGYMSRYGIERQDYSESDDVLPDEQQQQSTPPHLRRQQAPPPAITELYRRNNRQEHHQMAATPAAAAGSTAQMLNCSNAGATYGRPSTPRQHYDPQHCACNPQNDPRYCCYKAYPTSATEEVFRPSTQNLNVARHAGMKTTALHPTVSKKYPITARTPRYYRHPSSGLVYKRPSALCLPIITQPDPATCPRPRKSEYYHFDEEQQEIMSCCPNEPYPVVPLVTKTSAKRIDSEGDVHSKLNDLETLLTKFDADAEENFDETNSNNNVKDSVRLSEISDVAKILKPKIPSSVKAKQDKVTKLKAVRMQDVNFLTEEKKSPRELTLSNEVQDILIDSARKNKVPTPKPGGNLVSKLFLDRFSSNRPRTSMHFDAKPPLDDISALELHKSKSYIVSLIDKALSKELGTVPGEKCTRKEFMNMSPKRAINLVNRHASQRQDDEEKNKIVVNEDPGISNSVVNKKEDTTCACRTEEPLYLKQLKQLRWSHLRHIQREAKRLADLERFLDSFGESSDSLY